MQDVVLGALIALIALIAFVGVLAMFVERRQRRNTPCDEARCRSGLRA
jgi:hypothetical protein